MVLSYVLYSVIENCVCIDYLCHHSKKLSVISSDKSFKEVSYNGLLDIVILEVLMKLVSCHGLVKKSNSTFIFNCRYRLVNYHVEKGLLLLNTNLSS